MRLPPDTRRVRYSYPLDAVQERRGADFVHGLGSPGAHLVSGSAYLLRPERIPDDTVASLAFAAPIPLLPWAPDDRLRLGWRDLIHPGFHTFGGRRARVEVPGGAIEVAILAGPLRASQEELLVWVRTAGAEVAALAGGRFPHGRAAVTLVPLRRYAEASPYGQFLCSAPPSVALYVGDGAGPEELADDWVLVHELCHALHPIVRPRATWLSEGITTWLQQLARMRSGRLSEAAGWSGVVRGAQAGERQAGGESLRALSEGIGRRHAYRAVYWGGALFALDLDLELRRASGGAGLLTLLARLREGGPVCDEAAFAAAADRLAGRPLFAELLARHLEGPAFARRDVLLGELGVRADPEGVTLDDEAPRATERRALLSGG